MAATGPSPATCDRSRYEGSVGIEELESGAVPVAEGTTDRFRSPLIEPDLPISVIRLSDGIRSRHSHA
jgi:hypothetical protein